MKSSEREEPLVRFFFGGFVGFREVVPSFWDSISEMDMMSDSASLPAVVSWAVAEIVLAVEESGRLAVLISSPFLGGVF